jgi:hypothetical protein
VGTEMENISITGINALIFSFLGLNMIGTDAVKSLGKRKYS